jgi:hypothetical protein
MDGAIMARGADVDLGKHDKRIWLAVSVEATRK